MWCSPTWRPQRGDLAVGVLAQRGRVVAVVSDLRRDTGRRRSGHEWLPATDEPTRTPLLAGLSVGTGVRRTLLVANPSELDAVVAVRLSGTTGTFTPTGTPSLTVAPGAVGVLALPTSSAGRPGAVRLSSDVPVLAAVRSTRAGDDAYAGPADRLRGPALAPVLGGTTTTVRVTAASATANTRAGTGATVRLVAHDAGGSTVATTTLRPGPGATLGWSPPASAAYVVLDPVGPVAAAVAYAGAAWPRCP